MSVTTAIEPGDQVSLAISESPDPVTGTVTRVYLNAIDQETADIRLANGEIRPQCTRFLTLLRKADTQRTHLVVDSGIRTVRDLLDILPPAVAERIPESELRDTEFAAALRLLATIKDERWHAYVAPCAIIFGDLLMRAFEMNRADQMKISVAASIYGARGEQIGLGKCVRHLDIADYLAIMDALRITREGLTP